ncbi:hypothetical protein PIB30_052728 [Stylosanthes scabra]|uniref:Uncharacterized protein n=1 Tax=Stylosanthes scabra TaxID=79078 RepID=A0ABU6SI53_9FABA|nr:hypothetical protein [Stylosanthes scabra]
MRIFDFVESPNKRYLNSPIAKYIPAQSNNAILTALVMSDGFSSSKPIGWMHIEMESVGSDNEWNSSDETAEFQRLYTSEQDQGKHNKEKNRVQIHENSTTESQTIAAMQDIQVYFSSSLLSRYNITDNNDNG